jgi:MFS family permease
MTTHTATDPAAQAASRRDLWLVRLYYFIWMGGLGFILAFINLFFRRQGLSGTQIGVLGTVASVASLIAAPVWGHWSDRVPQPRRLIQIGLVVSAIMMMLLSQQRAFIWMAVLMAADAAVGAGVGPLSSALGMGVAHKVGYGSVRLWGSLGWAFVVLLAGWLIEQTGMFSMFVGYAIAMVISVVVVNLIRPGAIRSSGVVSSGGGAPLTVGGLLKNRMLLGLTVMLTIFLMGQIGVLRFEAIYLDELGASETVIGLVSTIGAVVELPGMIIADRVIQRYGARRALLAAMVIRVGMMIAVLAAPRVPTIIAIRAVNGIAFSLINVGWLTFVSDHTLPEQRNLALALFTVTLPGIVNVLGGPLSGLLYDTYGAYWLYAVALAGYALGWIVLRLTPSDQAHPATPGDSTL